MQQLIKSLDDSIQEATTRLVLAGDNCSVHNDILALLKRTRDHAGVLQERFGGTVFEARQVQCDELKKKVVIAMVNCNESDKAEKMYNTAGTMFQDAEYENASVLARQAKVIFEKSGNWAGVTKADRLVDNIDKMLAKLNESNSYYQKGQSAMRIADYENASFYLLKAREMYQNISRVKDVAKCDASLSELNIGNSTKGKADALYAEAQKNYEARDFGTAQIKANAAKEMYKRINDVEGIAKVDAFLKTIPVYNDSRWLVMGLIVFVFIAFIVLMWMKTKVSREKRERTEVEDKKKFEEEQKLAELEAERKKREEEKERMMIERKRLKEMLEQEKKAIRGGASEQRAAVRQETNASDGNGFAPSAEKQRVENERAMLEKMLGEERESLKKEKAVIVEQLGLRQSKDTKHDAPTENPEVISDREKIKEIVDTPTNNQPSIQQNSDGLDEIERLREMIKKERDAMKKGQ
jgi:tetratricopeptide (TPR) repeat protein